MESMVYHRTTCRLCGSGKVDRVLKMADCPPVDAYIPRSRLGERQELFPIDLYLCRDCGHGQLLDVVSPKLLFGSYIYTTSSSPGLVEYFRRYADDVMERLQLKPGAWALDIGSNDGTLLRHFKARGLTVLGVDPAESIARAATAAGTETLADFFNSGVAARIRQQRGTFDLVTANNVFAHSDDLGDMAKGVQMILAPGGVFVFEVSYLLDMIKGMIFDFIYHEHLSHHSVKPLQTFMARHGLHLFDVQKTPSKGGSLRCFAQLAGGPRPEASTVAELIREEARFGLYDLATYQAYSKRIEEAGDALRRLMEQRVAEGKKVAGYGASATGTVVTYQFGIGPFMKFIIDDNPDRQERFSPGHHIPIVSSKSLDDERPDDVVILVWRFADMIVARNRAYLERGGRFIVPLPTLKIIDAASLK
ncbi:MAG: class I SAM-dependent methyltransferase [Verrucomicrobiales bacterium]|nr:class I SAM-dependent methyltransferase [Verrucomicrobiales bacterium]